MELTGQPSGDGDDAKYQKLLAEIKQNNPALFCCYCECALTAENKTKEHIRPRSRGGKGGKITFKNVHPCCWPCNQEKRNMYLNEYLGFLHGQFGIQDDAVLNVKIRNVKNLMKNQKRK